MYGCACAPPNNARNDYIPLWLRFCIHLFLLLKIKYKVIVSENIAASFTVVLCRECKW